jgi:hypothetical protein
MEVTQIVINGIIISTLDKPIGLEVIKLSLDRDFQYSCVDTKIEAELKFYCASGKTELDEEYESKGVEGSGYIEITDSCGPNAETYQFNLDFKKYNNQGDFTTIGLIEVNSLWKKDLEKEVNLTTGGGNIVPFYIRNLPLRYGYSASSFQSEEWAQSPNKIIDINQPAGGVAKPDKIFYIYPKSNTTLNELETGYTLLAESVNVEQDVGLTLFDPEYEDVNGNIIPVPSVFHKAIPSLEPQAIFTNELEDGEVTLTTIGDTEFFIDFIGSSPNIRMNLYEYKEMIGIGTSFDKMKGYVNQLNDVSLMLATVPNSILYQHPTISTKTFTRTFNVKKGESVWIWYQMLQGQYLTSGGTYRMIFDKYKTTINRSIDIEFKITKNVKDVLVNSADIIPYHTETKAFLGQLALNFIFGTVENIGDTPCYSDLWFTRGDYLRGKINAADIIIKPSDFFRELEKVVCCGLGYFYDTDPEGEKKLMSVYDFYSDTLVPSQYQFSDSDLIDGIIEIAPFLSPYCKEINIGYSNSKDSPKDFCKQNSYSINNDSDSIYSKVSEFIASMYTITRALRLGTEDEELEYDNNIFILSGKYVTASPTNLNVTLSQTTGYLADSVETFPTIDNGINRRYSTAFNLFRHLYKWGFSLFNNKDTLTVKKYEGNSIYDYKIRDGSGSLSQYYIGLNDCKLPVVGEMVKVDRTIDNLLTDLIENAIYVPSQITFKTAKLSSLDLIAMRAHQYDLFSVSDGTNTYYGNLISANLEDDVTEIKLLRRFKDGL